MEQGAVATRARLGRRSSTRPWLQRAGGDGMLLISVSPTLVRGRSYSFSPFVYGLVHFSQLVALGVLCVAFLLAGPLGATR